MAGRGKNRKQKLLSSHQRSWIWGRHAILEILGAGVWPIVELYVQEDLPEGDSVAETAQARAIPLKRESGERLTELCHNREHQGFLARMGEFPYTDADALLNSLSGNPLLAVLDSIQDPYNFGALIRSAEVLGIDGIFIAERNQCGVNSMVARTSAGAVTRIPIARVSSLIDLAVRMKEHGIYIIGASEKGSSVLSGHDLKQAVAVVLGNEAVGISPDLLEACDLHARIPQQGSISSLNVAAAGAIVFYEAARQRHQGGG